MSEIKTPLIRLEEGKLYIPGPDEFVITENHTLNDILRFLIEQGGRDWEDGLEHIKILIELLEEEQQIDMKYRTLKILKEETYRSQPYVNTNDDMVRVTLTCSKNEWYNIKHHLEAVNDTDSR